MLINKESSGDLCLVISGTSANLQNITGNSLFEIELLNYNMTGTVPGAESSCHAIHSLEIAFVGE